MMTTKKLINAIHSSTIAKDLSSNLLEIIIDFLEVRDIFFCSHKGSELIAYSVHGDYLGTIVKTTNDEAKQNDQWLTGFEFDSNGAVYVALYSGFLAKYPIPSNQTVYSTQLIPRPKDQIFQHNIDIIINTHNIVDDTAPEGIVVLENDKYKSVFVTCMEPIFGIMQLSFDGKLQRIICPNMLDAPWSMEIVPSYFLKCTTSKFLQDSNLFMVEDGSRLRIIDIDIGKNGKIMSSLDFPLIGQDSIGDFAFIQPKINDKALLIVNLQHGIFQFHQCEMFWMLKRFFVNDKIKQFEELEEEKIKDCYGTSVGPDGAIYVSDHNRNRILRMNILDYDLILNEDKINDEIDCNEIDIQVFAKGIGMPNYCRWHNAQSIGLNFVRFPYDNAPSEIANDNDD